MRDRETGWGLWRLHAGSLLLMYDHVFFDGGGHVLGCRRSQPMGCGLGGDSATPAPRWRLELPPEARILARLQPARYSRAESGLLFKMGRFVMIHCISVY